MISQKIWLEKVDTSSCGMARARPERRRGESRVRAPAGRPQPNRTMNATSSANRPIASTSAKPIHIRPATRF